MKIRMKEDHAADKMYWCGEVYDVSDNLAVAWLYAGIAEEVQERPARRKKQEEDE